MRQVLLYRSRRDSKRWENYISYRSTHQKNALPSQPSDWKSTKTVDLIVILGVNLSIAANIRYLNVEPATHQTVSEKGIVNILLTVRFHSANDIAYCVKLNIQDL